MNQAEIIAMADAAGIDPYDMCSDHRIGVHRLEHFAALVAAKEREACAQVVKTKVIRSGYPPLVRAAQDFACDIAAAIRARGTKEGA